MPPIWALQDGWDLKSKGEIKLHRKAGRIQHTEERHGRTLGAEDEQVTRDHLPSYVRLENNGGNNLPSHHNPPRWLVCLTWNVTVPSLCGMLHQQQQKHTWDGVMGPFCAEKVMKSHERRRKKESIQHFSAPSIYSSNWNDGFYWWLWIFQALVSGMCSQIWIVSRHINPSRSTPLL